MSPWTLLVGDALAHLRKLPDGVAQCCVTSPPYWNLRDYKHAEQIGLEASPEEYVERLVAVFEEVRRVLREDGTLWLNLGDCYAGARGGAQGKNSAFAGRAAARDGVRARNVTTVVEGLKPKDLVGMPWRVAFALQAAGWWLRCDVIWSKPNPMPDSTTDRPTRSHEYVFMLSKSRHYFYDNDAVKEPAVSVAPAGNKERQTRHDHGGVDDPSRHQKTHVPWADVGGLRNRRSVWSIPTTPYPGAHFATFPEELPQVCIRAGSRAGDTVLDPFAGAGTTGLVALREGRRFVGVEINPEYAALAEERVRGQTLGLPLGGAA